MEFYKPVFWSIIIISLLLLIYGLFISKKEKRTSFLSKALYFPLGFLTVVLLTPSITFLLTMNVTNFEGTRGYAYMYGLPVVIIGLLLGWLIIHLLFKKGKNYFKIITSVFGLMTVALICTYTYLHFQDKKERLEYQRNAHSCQKQFKDGYRGFVIDTVYGSVKVRKMDSTYTEFRYRFGDKKLIKKYFYRGQKINKVPNYEKFKVLLRNGTTKEFLIPCYK